jgi:hypothetical protein
MNTKCEGKCKWLLFGVQEDDEDTENQTTNLCCLECDNRADETLVKKFRNCIHIFTSWGFCHGCGLHLKDPGPEVENKCGIC